MRIRGLERPAVLRSGAPVRGILVRRTVTLRATIRVIPTVLGTLVRL